MMTSATPQDAPSTDPKPGKPRGISQGIASRNRRWMQMCDTLGMKLAEIASQARASIRTVQVGIKSARAEEAQVKTREATDAEPLTSRELGDLKRQYSRMEYQTPEVMEWLASQQQDRHRRPGPKQDRS